MIRVRITFSKTDSLRFIGHLDLHHLWIRTFRRAGIQVVYSQGFHPQPKIHLAAALSLGYTGLNELMECWFEDALTLEDIRTRLILHGHPGIVIRQLEEIDLSAPPIQILVSGARYRIQIPDKDSDDLGQKLMDVFSQEEIVVERKNKPVNVRPFLIDYELLKETNQGNPILQVHLAAGENHTGRVDEVLDLIHIDPLGCLVERTLLELS